MWEPKEIIKVNEHTSIGVTEDDHRLVLLVQVEEDVWRPTSHIPAQILGELQRLAVAWGIVIG